MDRFIHLRLLFTIVKESTTRILAGINEIVIWSAAYPISDLVGKGELILGEV